MFLRMITGTQFTSEPVFCTNSNEQIPVNDVAKVSSHYS